MSNKFRKNVQNNLETCPKQFGNLSKQFRKFVEQKLVQHIFYRTSLAVDPPCSPNRRQPTFHFQNGAKYYYAFKRERCNGPLHTIYLTKPQYLPPAVLIRVRQWPHRFIDNVMPLQGQVVMGGWVYLRQDPVYEIVDDDGIVQILSGPQWV